MALPLSGPVCRPFLRLSAEGHRIRRLAPIPEISAGGPQHPASMNCPTMIVASPALVKYRVGILLPMLCLSALLGAAGMPPAGSEQSAVQATGSADVALAGKCLRNDRFNRFKLPAPLTRVPGR